MAEAQTESSGGQSEPVRALSVEDVCRIAALARLELSRERAEEYRSQLSGVLEYMRRLSTLDLSGVEPVDHPGAGRDGEPRANALDEDGPRTPSETLPTESLLRMAPATFEGFVAVPKVIGEGAA